MSKNTLNGTKIKAITDGYSNSDKVRKEFFTKPSIAELRVWFQRRVCFPRVWLLHAVALAAIGVG